MATHLFQGLQRRFLICLLAVVVAGHPANRAAAQQAEPPLMAAGGDTFPLAQQTPSTGQDSSTFNGAFGGVPLNSTGPEQVSLASYTSTLDEPLVPLAGSSAATPRPPGSKPGVFQQVMFTSTWMPGGGANGLGITDLWLQSTFGFPLPTPDSPLLLTPSFEAQFLDGPTSPDLPPRLYDAALQFRYLRKFTPEFGIDLAVSPGMHGDFEPNSGREFRIPSRAIGAYDWDPELQIVFGVAYLDREDINWLPVGGVIWTPNDCTRVEAIVPRPRFSRRFCYDGITEDWWYVAGEFGGGSYGIQRANGTPDVATTSDYRILLGLEQKTCDGINGRVEIGYVFGRKVEYLSGTPTFNPDPTFLLRVGVWY